MLKGLNNIYFEKKNINHKGIIFFIQRWTELFEQKTISSYQFYITNPIVGLYEILDVIDKTLDGSFNNISNYDACRCELLEIINDDLVLAKHMTGICNRLKSHLSTKVNLNDTHRLIRLKNELNYSLKKIEPHYQRYIMNDLLCSIKSNDLASIQNYMKSLSSLCIHKGWTPHGASSLVRKIFLKEISTEDEFDLDYLWNLFEKSLDKEIEFDTYIRVYFDSVKHNFSHEQFINLMERLNLKILSTNEVLNQYPNPEDYKSIFKSDAKYICLTSKAKDFYAASHKLINYVNSKTTILSFYNKLNNAVDDSMIYLIEKNTSKTIKVKRSSLYNYNAFLDSSNKVFENTMQVYSNTDSKIQITQNALKGVFNYTNISSCSVFPEEKFINLWIALESFMKTGQYSNIISHIKEVLPSITCKRYIYKLIRNFAEDCLRCKISPNIDELNINLKNDKKQDLVKSLISAIRNDDSYNILLNLCSTNYLLQFRLEELKHFLKDNKSVLDKINRHHQIVSWQIQRLYRIRNEIAHSALINNNYINTYISHLYDYLAILISEVVYISSENVIVCINEIFPYLKDNFDAFMDVDPKKLPKEFILENGIIDFL